MKLVFLNGQPKAGNHLLHRFDRLFNKITFGRSTNGWVLFAAEEKIKKLVRDDFMFLRGHYEWWDFHEQLIRERNCKMILIIRDLRDVITASFRSCRLGNRANAGNDIGKFNSLYDGNQEEFIEDSILDKNKIRNSSGPLYFKNCFLPWTKVDFCHVVKFENLIGSKGGGDDLVQKEELKQVAEFIGLPQTDEWYQKTALEIYTTTAPTFVFGGKVGAWKQYFSKKNIETFEKAAGGLNRKLGYK